MDWMILAALVSTSAPQTQTVGDAVRLLSGQGGLSGKPLAVAIEKARAAPLGSRDNPVRATMPDGERAYLHRLRCSDGTEPGFARSGSYGVGVYGNILDGYQLTCPGSAAVTVFMDMYHTHRESAPVPGFTIKR